MTTYIKNAKLVLENGILWDGVLVMEDDRILMYGAARDMTILKDAEIIDAQGKYVGPGFVDIHVHGSGSFLYDDPEKSSRHFLSHGETTILATPYYDLSKEEFLAAIDRVKMAIMKGGAAQNIIGFYMEGPYMNPKYGASPEKNKWRGEIKAADYMEIVDRAGTLTKVWAVAPEREGIDSFVQYARKVNPDTMISVGHSEATPEQVRRLKKYGLSLQTHCMNATGRVATWSGTRSCGPDEACMLDDDMYAEVICDSCAIHVNQDMLRLIMKIKGADRIVLITDSFVSSEQPPKDLQHATDLLFDANKQLCGSNLTMEVACRNMMTHTSCGIVQAFRMASLNPARVIGMADEIGSIAVGKRANLVIVDDMFNVERVILSGKVWQP